MKPIQIKGCEHYHINSEGVVVNTETGRVLKTDLNSNGYRRVTLWSKDQKRIRKFIHRLVAEHYVPNLDDKPMVNHKDGIKINNHFENLEWVTCKENTSHAFNHGLRKGPNRLPEGIIRSIRLDKRKGISTSNIMKRYDMPRHRVFDIVNRYYQDVI